MRTQLAVGFGTVVFLVVMAAVNLNFARQEEALRAKARREAAAGRAMHGFHAGRHVVLDCVEVHPTQ